MANNKVIAAVAVIVIVVIALGSYWMMTGNNDKQTVEGTYVPYEGHCVTFTDGTATYDDSFIKTYPNLILKDTGNETYMLTWDNCVGAITVSNGYLSGSATFTEKNTPYRELLRGECDGKVLYLYAEAISKDEKVTQSWVASFVKEGLSEKPQFMDSLLKGGEVFDAVESVVYEDGVAEKGTIEGKITVKYAHGLIGEMVIKGISGTSEKEFSFTYVQCSNSVILAYDSYLGIFTLRTDGNEILYENTYASDEVSEACEILYVGEATTTHSIPEFSGNVYKGTTYTVDSTGKSSSSDKCIAIGKSYGGIFDVINVYSGDCDTWVVSEIDAGYQLYGTYAYTENGMTCDTFVNGFISKDVKTVTMQYQKFYSDGMYSSSIAALNLVEGDGLIGVYEAGEWNDLVDYTRSTSQLTVPENYIVISSVENNIVRGTYGSNVFVGAYNGSNIKLSVCNQDVPYYGEEFLTLSVTDGGFIAKDSAILGDSIVAGLNTCQKLGSNVKVQPEKYTENVVDVGQTYYTFQILLNEATIDVESTEKLVCKYAQDGYYAFEFTDSDGKTMILNGTSGNSMIRLAGNIGGHICTYNLDVHSSQFVCLDREYVTDSGDDAVIVYRMSNDGKAVELLGYESINGKAYSGTLSVGVIIDGVYSTHTSNITIEFANQNSTVVENKDFCYVHIIMEDSKASKANACFNKEINGCVFKIEEYYSFSDDGKSLTLRGFGFSEDGSNIAQYGVLTLKS